MSKTEQIRQLNDQLRSTGTGGQIVLTRGAAGQREETVREIMTLVKSYNCFHPDSDPYGEHDFGAFDYKGQKYFWKIDYYDLQFRCLSEDPADARLTNRVLTIMLAGEY